LLGSTTAPSATLIGLSGQYTVHAYNRSATQDAYLAYGPTSAAVNSAVIPVVNNPPGVTQFVIPLPFRSVQTFTFSGPTFIGGLTAAGNVVIDITTGTGS
jgi:hypothetical protein